MKEQFYKVLRAAFGYDAPMYVISSQELYPYLGRILKEFTKVNDFRLKVAPSRVRLVEKYGEEEAVNTYKWRLANILIDIAEDLAPQSVIVVPSIGLAKYDEFGQFLQPVLEKQHIVIFPIDFQMVGPYTGQVTLTVGNIRKYYTVPMDVERAGSNIYVQTMANASLQEAIRMAKPNRDFSHNLDMALQASLLSILMLISYAVVKFIMRKRPAEDATSPQGRKIKLLQEQLLRSRTQVQDGDKSVVLDLIRRTSLESNDTARTSAGSNDALLDFAEPYTPMRLSYQLPSRNRRKSSLEDLDLKRDESEVSSSEKPEKSDKEKIKAEKLQTELRTRNASFIDKLRTVKIQELEKLADFLGDSWKHSEMYSFSRDEMQPFLEQFGLKPVGHDAKGHHPVYLADGSVGTMTPRTTNSKHPSREKLQWEFLRQLRNSFLEINITEYVVQDIIDERRSQLHLERGSKSSSNSMST